MDPGKSHWKNNIFLSFGEFETARMRTRPWQKRRRGGGEVLAIVRPREADWHAECPKMLGSGLQSDYPHHFRLRYLQLRAWQALTLCPCTK